MRAESGLPSIHTTWVRPPASRHLVQPSASSRASASVCHVTDRLQAPQKNLQSSVAPAHGALRGAANPRFLPPCPVLPLLGGIGAKSIAIIPSARQAAAPPWTLRKPFLSWPVS